MKIAARISMTALSTILVLGVALPVSAQPAPPAQPAVAPVVAPEAAPLPASTAPAAEKAFVKEVLDSIKAEPTSTKSGKSSKSKDKDKERDNSSGMGDVSSDKVPDSVKKVVESLNETTEDVTLDSLNSAREAVVKLDVLIDIEKRLNDLNKLRKDRQGIESALSGGFGGGIPMPAMQNPSPSEAPPSLIPQPAVSTGGMPAPSFAPSGDIEVSRITGASGRYAAQVKDVDGTSKLIRAGDKLADGSTIYAISRDGVTVTTTDKKTKTIQVKDISTVFSGR